MKDIPGFVIVLTTTCVQHPHCIFCTSREYLPNKLKKEKKKNRKANKKYFVEKTTLNINNYARYYCKIVVHDFY